MKRMIMYVAATAATFIGLFSCTADYVSFEETTKYLTVPSSVETITSEALPGQIKLKWNVPADSNYYFLRVSYYDPLTKKDVSRLASAYVDTMLIDNTRKRFGEYEFKFQTFNSKNEGGEIKTVKAVSEAAPTTETIVSESKVALTAEQLSFNAAPIEGQAADLVDGDLGTYVNTPWQGADMSKAPFYLQVVLKDPLQNLKIAYSMPSSKATGPKQVKVWVSDDGDEWRELIYIASGLVTGKGESWTSELIKADTPFKYLRWVIELSTSGGKYAWNMSEFSLYDVKLDIYDPEKVELD